MLEWSRRLVVRPTLGRNNDGLLRPIPSPSPFQPDGKPLGFHLRGHTHSSTTHTLYWGDSTE